MLKKMLNNQIYQCLILCKTLHVGFHGFIKFRYFTYCKKKFKHPGKNSGHEIPVIFFDIQKNRIVNAIKHIHITHYFSDLFNDGFNILSIFREM